MTKIVSIHSFRGGTGKSNITANLAAALALRGNRVGIVDTDIQSPGIHMIYQLDASRIERALNDFLFRRCPIEKTAYDVSSMLRKPAGCTGVVYLIPSSLKTGEIARVLKEGYDVSLLNDGLQAVCRALDLHFLLIDTHPGVNEETLLSIAMSDVLLLIIRPDAQDWQGTAVAVELARRLEVPRLLMLVNKLPSAFDAAEVRRRVQETYSAAVGAVFGQSEEMLELGSSDLFVVRYPDHDVSQQLRQLAALVEAD